MLRHLTQLRKFLDRRWLTIILFPFSFLALNTLFEALYLNASEAALRPVYLDGLVSICAALINFVTPHDPVLAYQNTLVSSKANLEVASTCAGFGPLFLLAAAILAFPGPIKSKIVGLIFGLILVFLLNLLRIIGLYLVMAYQPHWFLPVHVYFAPTLTIVLCCLFFAWWGFGTRETCHD